MGHWLVKRMYSPAQSNRGCVSECFCVYGLKYCQLSTCNELLLIIQYKIILLFGAMCEGKCTTYGVDDILPQSACYTD